MLLPLKIASLFVRASSRTGALHAIWTGSALDSAGTLIGVVRRYPLLNHEAPVHARTMHEGSPNVRDALKAVHPGE
jgi:hypothetical protein